VTANLTGLIADAGGGNPARVDALRQRVAAMDDDFPVVLLPVRLETRFVQVQVQVAVPDTLGDLAQALSGAATPLGQIAATNLATKRADTVALQKKFKTEVENPMCDVVATRLTTAAAALHEADLLARQHLDGDPKLVLTAIAALRANLSRAERSIARLRSQWQHDRLIAQLQAVAAHATTTLAVVETRVLPAAELRGELAVEQPARRGAAQVIAPTVLAAGAATFQTLLSGLPALRGDPAAADRLAAQATTIAVLPAAWKKQLTAALADASAGMAASDDLERLVAAIEAIPTDRDITVAPRPPATQLVDQLLVRIYPDDIAVDTHEEALTQTELDAGTTYWQHATAAGGDEEARRAAWRALCAGRGPRRAAWIAKITEPPAPAPPAGEDTANAILEALSTLRKRIAEVGDAEPGTRIEALLRAVQALRKALPARRVVPQWGLDRIREQWETTRAAIDRLVAETGRADPDPETAEMLERLNELVVQIDKAIESLPVSHPRPPQLPDVGPLKEGAWTRAARSGVLPERFLVVAVSGDDPVHAVAGAPVPADLKLSIDPTPDDPAAEQFTVDTNGDLVIGASIRWMVDYDEALAKGMAVTVPITASEAISGFDRVYAIGLRDGDPADGAQALTELLDNHHYGQTGLGLVAIGTPTNNTDRAASGYRSLDDPDESYAVEAGAPLVDAAQPDDEAAGDGLRLGRALGVEAQTFAHVDGADRRDAADAQAATAALYPATIGNWLFDNAAPLISRDTRARLRAFATAHVAARGLVPALRVGAQPYGVLPAIAYTRYVPDAGETLPATAPTDERDAQQRFDVLLSAVLNAAAADWATIRDRYVAYATDPGVSDPRAHFLELLGLEAVSSVSGYRFGVNVAGRHAAAATDPALQFGLPPSNGGPAAGAGFGPYALLQRFQPVLAQAFGVDPNAPLLAGGQVAEAYADVFLRVEDSRAYELRWLTRNHGLHGSPAGGDPGGDIAALLAAAPSALAGQSRADEHERSLLALLARQALLVAQRDAALEVLIAEGLATEEQLIEAGASAHFVVSSLLSPATLTPWSYLLLSLSDVGRLQGMTFSGRLFAYLSSGQVSMADFLTAGGATGIDGFAGGAYAPVAQGLARHRAALSALAALPVERVGALLMEHLDIASHRLDAWITGLAHRRLRALRAAKPVGAHVGAYGWVEDLGPRDGGHDLAANVPAALADPSRPIHQPDGSEGFLHAPSVNHAVTAAILRGGYISQRAEGDVENRMAVNLSSRRTRLAVSLIEGVRAGNSLGALLGYRLERFLHEYHATAGVTLDAVIGPLRSAFPSVAGVDATLNADTAARQVCDGLAIADAVNRWIAANASERSAGRTVYDILSDGNFTGRPWGLGSGIPAQTDQTHLDGIVRAIDHVADALDALGDIVIAEAVHQIALGNHARAAAVVSALAEGKAPPRPEVVDTPRTGTPLTHRILLSLADSAGAPAGWEAIAMTPRALAEPALNAWAAGLIGAPGDIRIRLVHASDQLPAGEVTIADLGLHALDLAAILGPGFETGLGELAVRALDARHPADLDDDIPPVALQADVLTRAPGWGDGVRTLAEVAPLVEAIAALLGRGRPADAHDYVLGEQPPAGTTSGVDVDELESRVTTARDALTDVAVDLLRLLAGDATLDAAALPDDGRAFVAAQDPVPDPPRWADREAWRAVLLRAVAFGVPAGLPPAQYENRVQVRRALRAAAETAFAEIIERLGKATLGADPTAASLTAAARAVFGEGFTIVPRAALRNRDELDTTLAAGRATAVQLDGWLEGLAGVREGCGGLADLLVLADAHGAHVPEAAVAQLPHVDGEPWMGDVLPAGADAQGRLSLAVYAPSELPADGATGAALLVDEWTEILPSAAETTGVAIHYDQPDSTPPQCALVAVTPQKRGAWQLGELVQTLHDTLELAKSRAVELEHLQTTMYGQLLPAIAGELVPAAAGGLPSTDTRVILDFGANN
jgi:hypothetical protein